jgi:hypothetical protein
MRVRTLSTMGTLIDVADMPGWKPSTTSGGEYSVSEGRVRFERRLVWTPCCEEHGAMLCVSSNRALWRCIACGAGAYIGASRRRTA